jgi:hypothetical protein
MVKWRLEFEADEWLANDLKAYQVQHPEIDFKKDLVQNYILELKKKVENLEAYARYIKEAAETPVEGSNPSQNTESPPNAVPQQAQKPSTNPLHLSLDFRKGKIYCQGLSTWVFKDDTCDRCQKSSPLTYLSCMQENKKRGINP